MGYRYKRAFDDPSGRKSTTVTVSDAMNELLKGYKLDRKFKEQKVICSWEEIMGATIAKRTSKCFAKDRALFVEISSAPLKSEMVMSRGKVLAHINNFLGEPYFKDIVFL